MRRILWRLYPFLVGALLILLIPAVWCLGWEGHGWWWDSPTTIPIKEAGNLYAHHQKYGGNDSDNDYVMNLTLRSKDTICVGRDVELSGTFFIRDTSGKNDTTLKGRRVTLKLLGAYLKGDPEESPAEIEILATEPTTGFANTTTPIGPVTIIYRYPSVAGNTSYVLLLSGRGINGIVPLDRAWSRRSVDSVHVEPTQTYQQMRTNRVLIVIGGAGVILATLMWVSPRKREEPLG